MSCPHILHASAYLLVDDCIIAINGREVSKKVYVKSKQTWLFNEQAMERSIKLLDLGLGLSQFIIISLISCGVPSQMLRAHCQGKMH